jgi:hypothetical protein
MSFRETGPEEFRRWEARTIQKEVGGVEEPKNELEGKTVQKKEKERQSWNLGTSEYYYLRIESQNAKNSTGSPE